MLIDLSLKAKVLLSLAVLLSKVAFSESKLKTFVLAGWPYGLRTSNLLESSSDPLVSTLICPALTRLNLQKQESEPYLLRSLEEKPLKWIFQLRQDIKWWDGNQVTTVDLHSYLSSTLRDLLAANSASVRKRPSPEFVLNTEGTVISVTWNSEPPFGPFVFNNKRFYKSSSNFLGGFQCAGTLKPVDRNGQSFFEPVSKNLTYSITLKKNPIDLKKDLQKNQILFSFLMGEELHPAGYQRQVEAVLPCEQKLDTYFVSVIAWNPGGDITKDAGFRNAMTLLLPRGPIMRVGAGGLGDLISAPILRSHPGYKKSLLVPSYDPIRAENILTRLGYKRSESDGFRRTSNGNSIELKIYVKDYDGSSLLRKVLDDSFRALGFRVVFLSTKDSYYDASLAVVETSWPDGELSHIMQADSRDKAWPWTYSNLVLDEAFEAYALSLTHRRPNFRLLERIHGLIYKEEPFSILMQHKICLNLQNSRGQSLPLGSINQRDPDWLVNLLQSAAAL